MFSLWFLTVTASMTVETSYWGGVPSSLGITLGKPLLTSVWKWVYSCICIMPAPEMYKYTIIKNSVFSVILPWLFFRFDNFIHKEFNVCFSKFVTGEEYMVWVISYSTVYLLIPVFVLSFLLQHMIQVKAFWILYV